MELITFAEQKESGCHVTLILSGALALKLGGRCIALLLPLDNWKSGTKRYKIVYGADDGVSWYVSTIQGLTCMYVSLLALIPDIL